MSKPLSDINFLDILPSSIATDPAMKAAALGLDAELKTITGLIAGLDLHKALSSLPEPILKHLAYQWHVDAWADGLNMDQKAALIEISYHWHRVKGTPAAVEMILNDVLGGGQVEEFWEYAGEEFHFRVISNDPPEDETAHAVLLAGIESAKNTRSILDLIIKRPSITGALFFGGAISAGISVKIYQE